MKNLYKILLSSVIIIIINIVIQTPSYSHGLQGLLSTISFFSKANASDHTAEKEVIKELKLAKGLEERYRSFKLLSKKFSNEAGQINAHITFKYDNEEDLFYVLKFEKAEDNLIHYRLFKDEILESSNDNNKTNDLKRNLIWDRETTLIKMTISENGNYKKANEGVSSISNYW